MSAGFLKFWPTLFQIKVKPNFLTFCQQLTLTFPQTIILKSPKRVLKIFLTFSTKGPPFGPMVPP